MAEIAPLLFSSESEKRQKKKIKKKKQKTSNQINTISGTPRATTDGRRHSNRIEKPIIRKIRLEFIGAQLDAEHRENAPFCGRKYSIGKVFVG
jgi:hypothetical protein